MDDDYDPGHEAEAAMKMAVTAGRSGNAGSAWEWAWQELARVRSLRAPCGESDATA